MTLNRTNCRISRVVQHLNSIMLLSFEIKKEIQEICFKTRALKRFQAEFGHYKPQLLPIYNNFNYRVVSDLDCSISLLKYLNKNISSYAILNRFFYYHSGVYRYFSENFLYIEQLINLFVILKVLHCNIKI